MNKLFVYLYRIILKNAKNSIMKMIKKYWWLLALGALAYWKWDEIKAMMNKNRGESSGVGSYSGNTNSGLNDATLQGIAGDLEGYDENGNGIPDILEN